MLRNATLRFKITSSVIVLVFLFSVFILIGVYLTNPRSMSDLALTCLRMKLSSDLQSSKDYVRDTYGALRLSDNRLVDHYGTPLDNRFEVVDEIKSKLEVLATVFSKRAPTTPESSPISFQITENGRLEHNSVHRARPIPLCDAERRT